MLNLITFDIADRHVLENSFNAFEDKSKVKIVNDKSEKDSLFKKVIDNFNYPNNSTISFQNLFKLKSTNGSFYVAQCLLDFGYPLGYRGSQTFEQKYAFYLIGFANLTIDLGVTHLRPKTRFDKMIPGIFHTDLDFKGNQKFNDRYHLVSDMGEDIFEHFDTKIIDVISRYNNIVLAINRKQLFLSFNEEFNTNHSRIAQEIISSFKYLEV